MKINNTRIQSSIGSTISKVNNDNLLVDDLGLARVVSVNYQNNTVDFQMILGGNAVVHDQSQEGKMSARLPVSLGGRNGYGNAYGSVTPIRPNDIILVGFLNKKIYMPIVLNRYVDDTVASELATTDKETVDPRSKTDYRLANAKRYVGPSGIYNFEDGNGNYTLSFGGRTFLLVNNDIPLNSHQTVDGPNPLSYDDLPASYYNGGKKIEPIKDTAPEFMFAHEGIVDSAGNPDNHGWYVQLAQDGSFKISALQADQDWRTYFYQLPDGRVGIRRQEDSKIFGSGSLNSEISIDSNGYVTVRSQSTGIVVRPDGLYNIEGTKLTLDSELSEITERLGKVEKTTVDLTNGLNSKVSEDELPDKISEALTPYQNQLNSMKDNIDSIEKNLEGIGDDGVITESDRKYLRSVWSQIQAQYPATVAQADQNKVDHSTLDGVYNTLKEYIEPILAATGNTDINPTDFNNNFNNYYTQQYSVQTAIFNAIHTQLQDAYQAATDAAKDANNAITAANSAQAMVNNVASQDYITSYGKSELSRMWTMIQNQYPVDVKEADAANVSHTDVDTAYNDLSSYITDNKILDPATTNIDGATLSSKFSTYFSKESALLSDVADANLKKLEDYGEDISSLSTSISQTKDNINLLAQNIQKQNDNLSVDQGQLSVMADQISGTVSSTDVTGLVNNSLAGMNLGDTNQFVVGSATKGTYLNGDTGAETSDANSWESDYIPVKNGETYSLSMYDNTETTKLSISFYDTDKKLLSGKEQASNNNPNVLYAKVPEVSSNALLNTDTPAVFNGNGSTPVSGVLYSADQTITSKQWHIEFDLSCSGTQGTYKVQTNNTFYNLFSDASCNGVSKHYSLNFDFPDGVAHPIDLWIIITNVPSTDTVTVSNATAVSISAAYAKVSSSDNTKNMYFGSGDAPSSWSPSYTDASQNVDDMNTLYKALQKQNSSIQKVINGNTVSSAANTSKIDTLFTNGLTQADIGILSAMLDTIESDNTYDNSLSSQYAVDISALNSLFDTVKTDINTIISSTEGSSHDSSEIKPQLQAYYSERATFLAAVKGKSDSEVSAAQTNLDNGLAQANQVITNKYSTFGQTADGIVLQVGKNTKGLDENSQQVSELNQRADQIDTTVKNISTGTANLVRDSQFNTFGKSDYWNASSISILSDQDRMGRVLDPSVLPIYTNRTFSTNSYSVKENARYHFKYTASPVLGGAYNFFLSTYWGYNKYPDMAGAHISMNPNTGTDALPIANLFSPANLNAGYLNNSNGTVSSSASDVYTEVFSVTGFPYFYFHSLNTPWVTRSSDSKLAFWDSSGTFISVVGLEDGENNIPSSAATARISINYVKQGGTASGWSSWFTNNGYYATLTKKSGQGAALLNSSYNSVEFILNANTPYTLYTDQPKDSNGVPPLLFGLDDMDLSDTGTNGVYSGHPVKVTTDSSGIVKVSSPSGSISGNIYLQEFHANSGSVFLDGNQDGANILSSQDDGSHNDTYSMDYDITSPADAKYTELYFDTRSSSSTNLFKMSAADDGYINASGTIAYPDADNKTSDYIPVTPGKVYTYQTWVLVNKTGSYSATWDGYLFYDANKKQVGSRMVVNNNSCATNTLQHTTAAITVPSGVAYIRVGSRFLAYGLAKFEEGSTSTNWSPDSSDSNYYSKVQLSGFDIDFVTADSLSSTIYADKFGSSLVVDFKNSDSSVLNSNLTGSGNVAYTMANQGDQYTWRIKAKSVTAPTQGSLLKVSVMEYSDAGTTLVGQTDFTPTVTGDFTVLTGTGTIKESNTKYIALGLVLPTDGEVLITEPEIYMGNKLPSTYTMSAEDVQDAITKVTQTADTWSVFAQKNGIMTGIQVNDDGTVNFDALQVTIPGNLVVGKMNAVSLVSSDISNPFTHVPLNVDSTYSGTDEEFILYGTGDLTLNKGKLTISGKVEDGNDSTKLTGQIFGSEVAPYGFMNYITDLNGYVMNEARLSQGVLDLSRMIVAPKQMSDGTMVPQYLYGEVLPDDFYGNEAHYSDVVKYNGWGNYFGINIYRIGHFVQINFGISHSATGSDNKLFSLPAWALPVSTYSPAIGTAGFFTNYGNGSTGTSAMLYVYPGEAYVQSYPNLGSGMLYGFMQYKGVDIDDTNFE